MSGDFKTVKYIETKVPNPVELVEVKHGHWEEIEIIDDDSDSGVNNEVAQCSMCKAVQGSYYWATNYYNYCPHCGALMDEEGEEE